MTDAITSYVVNKMGDYLTRQASMFLGVEEEVVKLKRRLEYLQAVVKDAEEKELYKENNVSQVRVSQVRDIAYDIEDVLDDYILKVEEERKQDQTLFLAWLKRCFCLCKEGRDQYSIAKEIQKLNERILEISPTDGQISDINLVARDSGEGTTKKLAKLKSLRRTNSKMTQEDVVGLVNDIDILRGKLLDQNLKRMVITIFGQGGLGKTTLAKKLYHCAEVHKKFNYHAWVCVSKDYETKDLLRKMIKSFWKPREDELKMINEMEREDLENHLHEKLSKNSYLLIVDDIWEKNAWQSLKKALPDDNNGSRVIMTTRIRGVADAVDKNTYPYVLPSLRFEESWDLFTQTEFQDFDIDRNEQKKMAKEMIRKCNGLPLVIIVLRDLLARKKFEEWDSVYKHIWPHLEKENDHVSNLLNLSFMDLPHHLKLCFLYLGVFPEDFEIPKAQLILLLIAEGFIPRNEGIMEHMAEGYLIELSERSLIQVERRKDRKYSATLRVHDLLRDLAVKKAKEMNLIHINDQSSSFCTSSCRTQAFHGKINNLSQIRDLNPRTRSIILFGECGHPWGFEEALQIISQGFKFLRALDFGMGHPSSSVEKFKDTQSNGFDQLIHLRYLALSVNLMKVYSTSINNLQGLETLILRGFSRNIYKEAIDIRNLKSIRHFKSVGVTTEVLLNPDAIHLRTLMKIPFSSWKKIEPAKLIHLEELGLNWKTSIASEDDGSLGKLKNLRVLFLGARLFEKSFLNQLVQCGNLVRLELFGVIEKFPEDVHLHFRNLECLILFMSRLEEDPMPLLGKLPKLKCLVFSGGVYAGEKMVCGADSFRQLETLHLYSDPFIKELHVEEGAMPMLTVLAANLRREQLKIPERLLAMVQRNRSDLRQYFDRGDLPVML